MWYTINSWSKCPGDIEIVVVNVGSKTSNNDQFWCLAKGGSAGENYFEFPIIDDAVILPCIDPIRDELCERPTPKPTWKTASNSSDSSNGGNKWNNNDE